MILVASAAKPVAADNSPNSPATQQIRSSFLSISSSILSLTRSVLVICLNSEEERKRSVDCVVSCVNDDIEHVVKPKKDEEEEEPSYFLSVCTVHTQYKAPKRKRKELLFCELWEKETKLRGKSKTKGFFDYKVFSFLIIKLHVYEHLPWNVLIKKKKNAYEIV